MKISALGEARIGSVDEGTDCVYVTHGICARHDHDGWLSVSQRLRAPRVVLTSGHPAKPLSTTKVSLARLIQSVARDYQDDGVRQTVAIADL